MAKQADIFGVEPEIGDTIIWNPPKHKGLVYGTCIGFMSSGLPEVEINEFRILGQSTKNGNYTPKTGFVVRRTLMRMM